MRCPACGSTLTIKRFGKVEVDFCDACKGVWLDEGELEEVLERIIATQNVPDAPLDLDKEVVSVFNIEEEKRSCPRCGTEMSKINYAYDSNVILDKCGDCGGLWADEGEIERLAVFRKGNPILDRMGEAIAMEKDASLRARYDAVSGSQRRPLIPGIGIGIVMPVGDDQECDTFPFVVALLAVANILVFVYQILFLHGRGAEETFYKQFGLVPTEAFTSLHGGASFVTSMFIHCGFLHLAGNMLFLVIFGDNIEDRLGHMKFLLLYTVSGLAAGALHALANPASTLPAVGASGAISGAMGAYFALYPAAKIKTLFYNTIVDIPAFAYLGGWLALQIASAWLAKNNPLGGGVAWFAHIGGFIIGVAAGLWIKYAGERRTTPTEHTDM